MERKQVGLFVRRRSGNHDLYVRLKAGQSVSINDLIERVKSLDHLNGLTATWFAIPIDELVGSYKFVATAISHNWKGPHPKLTAVINADAQLVTSLRGSARVLLLTLPDMQRELVAGHFATLRQGQVFKP